MLTLFLVLPCTPPQLSPTHSTVVAIGPLHGFRSRSLETLGNPPQGHREEQRRNRDSSPTGVNPTARAPATPVPQASPSLQGHPSDSGSHSAQLSEQCRPCAWGRMNLEEEELAEVSPVEMDSIPIPAKCRIHLPLVHYS